MKTALVAVIGCALMAAVATNADAGGATLGVSAGGALPSSEGRVFDGGVWQIDPVVGVFAGYDFAAGGVIVEPGAAVAYSLFSRGSSFRGTWLLVTPRVRVVFPHPDFDAFVDAGIGYGRTTGRFRGNTDEPWTDVPSESFAQAYSIGVGAGVDLAPNIQVGGRLSMEGPELARDGFLLYGAHNVGVTAFVSTHLGARATIDIPPPAAERSWFIGTALTGGWLEPVGCDGYCRGTPAFGLGLSGGVRVASRVFVTASAWGHAGDRENMQLFAGPGVELRAAPLAARASVGVGYRNHHDADGSPQDETSLALSLELSRALGVVTHRATDAVVRVGYQPGDGDNDTVSVTVGIGLRWR